MKKVFLILPITFLCGCHRQETFQSTIPQSDLEAIIIRQEATIDSLQSEVGKLSGIADDQTDIIERAKLACVDGDLKLVWKILNGRRQ